MSETRDEGMSGKGPIEEWLWTPLMDDTPRHGAKRAKPKPKTLDDAIGLIHAELVRRVLAKRSPKP